MQGQSLNVMAPASTASPAAGAGARLRRELRKGGRRCGADDAPRSEVAVSEADPSMSGPTALITSSNFQTFNARSASVAPT
jgi:hypothetical protein